MTDRTTMNLTESEQRDIEDAAMFQFGDLPAARIGYIAGATAMAEKKNLEIEASNVSIKIWKNTAGEFKKYNDDLKAQLEAAQAELEKERLRLAACGVAALSNTEESIKNQRLAPDSEYYSGSYEDVCRAVNREMSYREELSRVKEVASRMAQHLMHYVNEEDEIGTQILNNYKNGLLH